MTLPGNRCSLFALLLNLDLQLAFTHRTCGSEFLRPANPGIGRSASLSLCIELLCEEVLAGWASPKRLKEREEPASAPQVAVSLSHQNSDTPDS